jgi:hypothetical protein
MNKLLKTDNEQFSKDPSSGALINTDMRAYQAALARKRNYNRIDSIEMQVANLHAEVKKTDNTLEEIKNLLNTILRNTNG